MNANLIFAILIHLSCFAGAQSFTEADLVGEWSCCGTIDFESGKEVKLQKIELTFFQANCTEPPCITSSVTFARADSANTIVWRGMQGCRNQLTGSSYSSTFSGEAWFLTTNKKYIILGGLYGAKQCRLLIVRFDKNNLVLKKT